MNLGDQVSGWGNTIVSLGSGVGNVGDQMAGLFSQGADKISLASLGFANHGGLNLGSANLGDQNLGSGNVGSGNVEYSTAAQGQWDFGDGDGVVG
ncbi:hypothetical protein, partial [Mycobacterium intermedium]|uniref:hypothetical protein n=1 Tax=Mycobacterium intermedium TaxID=28445 RepID=UPI003D15F8A2